VHIGGGDPLLRPDKLKRVLDIAAEVDVSVEYVETNSSNELNPVEFYLRR
jgi:MoaA/NifB/PqqE/SkfB family radical SAM enzyme